ncbi:predicted protein [Uncinocarpus reesii 1704]|uniref:Uncharacterized protein n=1 Tax=Uncinocarpus reesii (strain UAMH 1704) TaxID=336963 RepID=C4JIU8_UNCRE|nr:uncharacterized protein UREG_02959 [Uncinocarpus reesii 1704]EEP78110.1 predicted protein [Uncinocarpus reesii 1704]
MIKQFVKSKFKKYHKHQMLVACEKQKTEKKKKHNKEVMQTQEEIKNKIYQKIKIKLAVHSIAVCIQTHIHAMMTALEVKVIVHEHNHLAAADLSKNEMKKKMKTFQSYLQTLLNKKMLSSSEKMNKKKFEIVISFNKEKKNEKKKND